MRPAKATRHTLPSGLGTSRIWRHPFALRNYNSSETQLVAAGCERVCDRIMRASILGAFDLSVTRRGRATSLSPTHGPVM